MPDPMDVPDGERSSENDGLTSPDAQTNANSSPEAVDAGGPTAASADATSEQAAAVAGAEPYESDPRDPAQQLFDFIFSCTDPAPLLNERWNFLGEHDGWLRIDMPPDEFVATLEQHYSAEVLTELELFERVNDEFRLSDWLDGDAPLYVLNDEDNDRIVFSRRNQYLFPMIHTALDYALERSRLILLKRPTLSSFSIRKMRSTSCSG